MRALTLFLTIVLFNYSNGQEYSMSDDFEITIQGTSTLHDWEINCTEAEGSAHFLVKNGKIKSVETLSIQINATSLKSGKEGMDENTYKALKVESFPSILFSLSNVKSIKVRDKTTYKIEFDGLIEVSGIQKTVTSMVSCITNKNGIQCEGILNLQMTDFKIDPPTALFGSIETDNNISVYYNTTYVR